MSALFINTTTVNLSALYWQSYFCVFRPKSPSCRGKGKARRTWRKTLSEGSKCSSMRWSKRGECPTTHCFCSPPTAHTYLSKSPTNAVFSGFIIKKKVPATETVLRGTVAVSDSHWSTKHHVGFVDKDSNRCVSAICRVACSATELNWCLKSSGLSLPFFSPSPFPLIFSVPVWCLSWCQQKQSAREIPPSPAGVMSPFESKCWHERFVCCQMLMAARSPAGGQNWKERGVLSLPKARSPLARSF